jgi:hypothetical protein
MKRSDCHRELPIKLARQAAQKGHGNENRAEREHDCDHRSADLLHREDRGGAGRFVFGPHDALDVFENQDGVVDDDAEGKHQPEQCQEIDREPQEIHPGESADEGDRNRHDGNQRGAPALQEDEDDRDHQ